MADPYDFQINTLKFRMAITDQSPYVRSTAPFRKEQLDTAATVGDQSLTGWWTRGQLSFHRGAGLKYYEVLDGETVLNRFKESQNVRVFDELGEVALAVLPSQKYTGTANAVASPTTGTLVWTDIYVQDWHYLSGPNAAQTTKTANDGTDSLSITAFNRKVYLATGGKKIERWNLTTYVDTIYSHTQRILHVWYGKDRLWIVDALGDVYAVSPNPTGVLPIALSGPVARLTLNSDEIISFSEDGGPVFCSVGTNYIYSFTVGSDGAVTALTAPVVAGVLPQGERAICLRGHMGYLVIVTTTGARLAAVQNDRLTIGPRIVKWLDSACTSIAANGSFVYVAGQLKDENGDYYTAIYEVDLSEAESGNSLTFPYREAWRYADAAAPARSGSVYLGESFWGHACFYSEGASTSTLEVEPSVETLHPTGYITTAFHRFGTLDLKRFQKVTVRARGAGTIEVFRVDADGTETSLGSMNASAETATFDVLLSNAVERIAFKFVLSRDPANTWDGPTFLGYQLKALPVPERQRLHRVPLLVQDKVNLRHGTRVGRDGKAYADITALEALERDQAIVTFTDHRTGETGTAYIDQVDFQADSPATDSSNGFGGIAYVTLRVLE